MTNFDTGESRDSDALLNDSLSDAEGDAAFLEDDEALRLARIDEFGQESLHDENALEASVGGFMCGLMKISVHYEKNMIKGLELHSGPIHDSPELNRSANTYLNMLRQIDRFANLNTRLAENRQRTANIKSQRRRAITPGSMPEPSPRNKR
jgi:hypothetical protein